MAVVYMKVVSDTCTRREHKAENTHVRVAQRDVNLLDALGLSGGLSLTVQSDRRDTGGVGEDLNVLHRSSCALGRDTERLEHGLLADPTGCEGRRGGGLRAAVRDLCVSEVALDERGVPRGDG